MNSRDEVAYRLGLAKGFLSEAEQDVELKRWRSCVDNSQLAAENSGKVVLSLFGVSPKTHEPAKELASLVVSRPVPPIVQDMIQAILPDLLALGHSEHLMTDYGDETTYTLPWDLFTEDSATEALDTARRVLARAEEIIAHLTS